VSNQKKIKRDSRTVKKDGREFFVGPAVEFEQIINPSPAVDALAEKIYELVVAEGNDLPNSLAALLFATQILQAESLEKAGSLKGDEAKAFHKKLEEIMELLAPHLFVEKDGLYAAMAVSQAALMYFNGMALSKDKYLEEQAKNDPS
jgi:hypothetical protein